MLCRTVLTAIAISYILCVLLLSGVQKEDIDVSTLKKLERHNVNIDDMNNETLHQECIGQAQLLPESSTQLHIKKIEITDKNYENETYTHTPYTLNTIAYAIQADQNSTNKELETQKYVQKASNVSDTRNKGDKRYDNIRALNKIISFWNELKNNTNLLANKAQMVTANTSPAAETIVNTNVQLRSSDIEYFKTMVDGYLSYHNITTTKQNITNIQTDTESVPNIPEDLENNEKLQVTSEIKSVIGKQNVSPAYNIGEQMTSSVPSDIINNAGSIDSNFNVLAKGAADNFDPRNMITNINKHSKPEQALVNEASREIMNIESLVRNIEPTLHTNKRELNDIPLQQTNSQFIRKPSGLAASEFYPKLMGQSPQNSERDNNLVKDSKDTTNMATLEDWYSHFFTKNMETSPSLASNNNQKELAKESLFDATYSKFNNNKKQADKSNEKYEEYSPINANYKTDKITPSTTPLEETDYEESPSKPLGETDNEEFDPNSLWNNDRTTDKSKDTPYPYFNPKGFNIDFASNIPLPARDNKEDNVPTFERNKNKKVVVKTSFLMKTPTFENYNLLNSPKNNRYKNKGNTLEMNHSVNYHYERSDGDKDAPYVENKPTPDYLISSFLKLNAAHPANKGSLLSDYDEYSQTPEDTTIPENYQSFNSLANNGKQTNDLNLAGNFPNFITNEDVEMPKPIPPFLENFLKRKKKFPLKKPKAKAAHQNVEVANDSVLDDDLTTTDNENMVIKNSQDNMQFIPKFDRNTVIQGNQLKLIQNSLQYINQILAMNEEATTSTRPNTEHKSSNINNNQTAKLNVIKQRKNKWFKKMTTQSNQSNEKDMKNLKVIPADLINQIAESVKNIILRDIKNEISTETPATSTTPLATTITTVQTTVTTAEITTAATEKQDDNKNKDTNYVVQKLLELFRELKTDGTTSTTLSPAKLMKTHITKYVYSTSKTDQLPPMPVYNPFEIKPDIITTNFTNSYNVITLNKSNMNKIQAQMVNRTSLIITQPQQMLNQPEQMKKQSARILNHQLQKLSQPPQFYNQPQFMLNGPPQPVVLNQPQPQIMNQAPLVSNDGLQIINQPPQVTYQAPQNMYYPPMFDQPSPMLYGPAQMMNQPPLFTNPTLQNIYHFPQILNHDAKMINRAPQTMNQHQQSRINDRQILNQREEMMNQPQYNQPSQMFNQGPAMTPQRLNQPSKNMNRAQQMLNQVLQMKNQASQMINDSPEMSNQSPQFESRPQTAVKQGLQMRNQAIQMMNNYPQVNQRQIHSNGSPQTLKHAPTMHQSSDTNKPEPHITVPFTNTFQSPPYVTLQTNSLEIQPLGIPIEKPKGVLNQVIIVTTNGPFEKSKVLEQREPRNRLNEMLKEREQNRSEFTKKLRESDSLKQSEYREPPRNRSTKHWGNSFYKNYSAVHREPYQSKFKDKRPDYERARSRHLAIKKFHEQLERIEDWSKSERKKSRDKLKDSFDDVPSRLQVPLTKIKQRVRYDDTHFKNFLKTQEKVNDMLEAILATKKSNRPRSVENP